MSLNNRVNSAVLYSILPTLDAQDTSKVNVSFSHQNQVTLIIEGQELAEDIADAICDNLDIQRARLKVKISLVSAYETDDNGQITLVEAFRPIRPCFDYMISRDAASEEDESLIKWRYFFAVGSTTPLSDNLFKFINNDENRGAVSRLIEDFVNSTAICNS